MVKHLRNVEGSARGLGGVGGPSRVLVGDQEKRLHSYGICSQVEAHLAHSLHTFRRYVKTELYKLALNIIS